MRVISLLDIICSKVHFHTWNFQLAQQEAVQGRVHRVVTSFSIIIMLKSVTFNLAGVVKIIYLVTARSIRSANEYYFYVDIDVITDTHSAEICGTAGWR